jgi:hypothetical protein
MLFSITVVALGKRSVTMLERQALENILRPKVFSTIGPSERKADTDF